MRALFLLLVLGNVAFYAWSRLVAAPDAATDPAPLGRQIDPGKLRIVPPEEAAARASKRAAPSPLVLASAPTGTSPSATDCLEWGSFTLTDLPKAQAALAAFSTAQVSQRRTEELAGWWVFIPPQGSRQAAARKASELKSLGVHDYFVVQDETPLRWALSLGVFRNEEAAQARLTALRRQGVRSAEAAPRETVVPKVWLQVRAMDAALERRLREIAGQVEGSEVRACP